MRIVAGLYMFVGALALTLFPLAIWNFHSAGAKFLLTLWGLAVFGLAGAAEHHIINRSK